jgi:Ca2+-binding RTX toxin-like protein
MSFAQSYFPGTSANERFVLPEYDPPVPAIVEGEGGNDYIYATLTNDLLYGGLGIDVIRGRDGDDTIYGDLYPGTEGGNDQLLSGSGDDVVFGSAGDDYVNASDGDDFVSGGNDADYIVGGLGADEIYGDSGNDFLFGNGVVPGGPLPILEIITVSVDGVTGLPITPEQFGGDMGELPIVDDNASDQLYGGTGHDAAWGFGGDDEIYGGKGHDDLAGGLGNDLLVGGLGNDQFVFAEFGKINFDRILDFHPGDTFGLDVEVFKGLGDAGTTLAAKYFYIGSAPETPDDRIIYDVKKAAVFYDRDGSGDTYAMKKIAVVELGTILDHADFQLT